MPDTAVASPLTAQRLAIYGFASVVAASAVVAKAFRDRANFYSAAVWLGRSNGCMLVLFNLGVFLTILVGKACQAIFFGPLRPIEVEHLYERSWYAVTETLLAMTIFRDEFDASFVILFGTLLFLKMFHWLCADRVELMEQSPSLSRLFHARMISVLWTLLCLDIFLVAFSVEVLIMDKQRMGIMIMFASEFMILAATLGSTAVKYLINYFDYLSDEPWEGKSIWVSGVDLVTDFLKLVVYLCFFSLILTYYGLPLNIVRDVYVTARSFFGRVRDLIRYRAATRNMDTRFPNASVEDLSRTDATCIICRDEMVAPDAPAEANAPAPPVSNGLNDTPKKLLCGHIFHFHCLRSWLERQQSCPTCRRTVFDTQAPGSTDTAPNAPQQPENAPRAGPPMAPSTAAAEALLNHAAQRHQEPDVAGQVLSHNGRRTQGTPSQHNPAASPFAPAMTTSNATLARSASLQTTRRRLQRLVEQALDHPARPAEPSMRFGQATGSGSSQVDAWLPPPPQSLALPREFAVSPSSPTSPASFHAALPGPFLGPTAEEGQGSHFPLRRVEESRESDISPDGPEQPCLAADPDDPRAAARAAALKRFGSLASTSTASTRNHGSGNLSQPGLPASTGAPSSAATEKPRLFLGAAEKPVHFAAHSSISDYDDVLNECAALSPADYSMLSQPSRRALEAQAGVVQRNQERLWYIQQDIARALSCLPVAISPLPDNSHDNGASQSPGWWSGPTLDLDEITSDDDANTLAAVQNDGEGDTVATDVLGDPKGKRAAEGPNAAPPTGWKDEPNVKSSSAAEVYDDVSTQGR